ncbi:hypothetical protein AB4K20DRAFT_1917290 [Rhizopus microsporus]
MDALVYIVRTKNQFLSLQYKKYLRFFMDHQSYSIQQLKVYRAVIVSVFRVLYLHMPPISSNVIIQDFFRQS